MNLVSPKLTVCEPTAGAARRNLRIVSYNIRAALSSSVSTLVDVLQELEPDIVALQEVDRDTERSGFADQAMEIADGLGLAYSYAATRTEGQGEYGVALLSRLPFAEVSRVELPENFSWEPRVALQATLCTDSGTLDVYNVHADIWPWSSSSQLQYLQERISRAQRRSTVVLGDFNATADQAGPTAFDAEAWFDVLGHMADSPTYMGVPFPRRIDHIFTSADLTDSVQDAGVLRRSASDHFPVWMDIEL